MGGMSAVIPKVITGQKPSHDRGDRNGAKKLSLSALFSNIRLLSMPLAMMW